MLLNFGAQNFYCFKEGVNVSLEFGGKCPEDISNGQPVSNLLCIKGANGSGKTNLLKILSFLNYFCCDSWDQKPDTEIQVVSFFRSEKPIDLYCEFSVEGIRYLYEVSLTHKKILSEKFSRTKKRLSPIFERKKDKITYRINEFSALDDIKLRTNASVFSTANQYEIKKFEKFYFFFHNILVNVDSLGRNDFSPDISTLSRYYQKNPKIFESLIEILKSADLGIDSIKIETRKEENGDDRFYPIFTHTPKEVKFNFLTYLEQSSGTKAIFSNFPFYYIALQYGGVLVLDELDKDLHPHILPKIVDFFSDPEKNPRNAQLVFTIHNTEIIDTLTKYRTFLVNKEQSESYGYRLDEIPGDLLRNDRSIATIYDKGKIGGVPLL